MPARQILIDSRRKRDRRSVRLVAAVVGIPKTRQIHQTLKEVHHRYIAQRQYRGPINNIRTRGQTPGALVRKAMQIKNSGTEFSHHVRLESKLR